MSELEEAIARHRAAIQARESAALAGIFRAYQPVRARLLERITELADEIEQRQERDDIVPGSLILRQERAVALLQQTQDEMTRLAGESLQPITGGQADAVDLATGHVLELVQALAPDPAILGSFNRLNTPALEAMVGRMSDGAPLQGWLAQFGPQTALDLGTALQRAAALGTNPRGVARELARQLDIAETRLLTMARTEILNSYRDATLERYRQNDDFLDGWFWVAARQPRTCLACLSLDGTKFPLSEPFQRAHVNCRCSSVPAFKGETRLPIETAGEWFSGQPEGTRRGMVPISAWEDVRAGRITLDDFVHLDRDNRWGDRYRQASVSQARANAARRRRSRAA